MAAKEVLRSRWFGFAVCLAIAVVPFFTPVPDGLTVQGWRLLGIFVATIVSFLLRPFPMGLMVMLALTGLAATGTLEFESILVGGFSKKVVWLVVAAFLIAGAVGRTGFGRRIALTLVTWFGQSTLGLGYSVCAAELALGPVVPSNTARGGGILAPIVDSLSGALGSSATDRPERTGRYLVLVGSHANLITAAMFLTLLCELPHARIWSAPCPLSPYHHPNTFHQAIPTVSQIDRWNSDISAPTRNH